MPNDVLLKNRVRLYHAIPLHDFEFYVESGGVVSRNFLSDGLRDYTRFFSDDQDRQTEYWDRVFGNMTDFGKYFFNSQDASNAVPNAYGAIQLVFNSQVWDGLQDVSITDGTITTNPYTYNLEDFESMFHGWDPDEKLRRGFYSKAEMSSESNIISFDYLESIIVDPIVWNNRRLFDIVVELLPDNLRGLVIERSFEDESVLQIYNQLLIWSNDLAGGLLENNRPLEESLPEYLRNWFDTLWVVRKRALASWLTYTYNGTLSRI